jgi:hypothetical protein
MPSVPRVKNYSFDRLSRELNIFIASFLNYPELKLCRQHFQHSLAIPTCRFLHKYLVTFDPCSLGVSRRKSEDREERSSGQFRRLSYQRGRTCSGIWICSCIGIFLTQAALNSEPAAGLPLLPLRKRVLAQRAFSCLPPSWPRTFCAELLSLSDRHKVSKVNCFDS